MMTIKEEKVYLWGLLSLKPDNVETIFNQNFHSWLWELSHEVTFNGEIVTNEIDKIFKGGHFKDGDKNNISDRTTSNKTKEGFPLTKNDFIEHELKKYSSLFEQTKGSNVNLTSHKKISLYIDYLNGLRNTPINSKGFQSSLTDSQIDRLYNSLQGGYINTTLTNFKAIFKNECLPDDFKPIQRLKPFTLVLCAYFVSALFQKDNPNDYWSIAEQCFNGRNLRQSINNVNQFDQKPKNYQKIDVILKNIYTPLQ